MTPGGCRRGARRGYRRSGTRSARTSATTAASTTPGCSSDPDATFSDVTSTTPLTRGGPTNGVRSRRTGHHRMTAACSSLRQASGAGAGITVDQRGRRDARVTESRPVSKCRCSSRPRSARRGPSIQRCRYRVGGSRTGQRDIGQQSAASGRARFARQCAHRPFGSSMRRVATQCRSRRCTSARRPTPHAHLRREPASVVQPRRPMGKSSSRWDQPRKTNARKTPT
jgi:hypothetical protein